LNVLDVLYVERIEQADALLKPKRVEVLRRLAEPSTCTIIGEALGESPQSIYYHVKRLQSAGLVTLVDERRVRGIAEGIYQSVARSFWVSPALVGRLGPARAPSDLLGLGYLLDLSETLQADLAGLAAGPPGLPSFGISGEIHLAADEGAAFVADLQAAMSTVLERYGGGEGAPFRLALACYPRPAEARREEAAAEPGAAAAAQARPALPDEDAAGPSPAAPAVRDEDVPAGPSPAAPAVPDEDVPGPPSPAEPAPFAAFDPTAFEQVAADDPAIPPLPRPAGDEPDA
jgi:DNA-binding transcriptional ArsR family regulator